MAKKVCLTLEDDTNSRSRNVRSNHQSTLRNIPKDLKKRSSATEKSVEGACE